MLRKDEGMLNNEPVTPSSQSGDVIKTLCELKATNEAFGLRIELRGRQN